MYKIFYIKPTKLLITLQTHINEFSFFDMCFEFMQRFRQVSVFYGLTALALELASPQSFKKKSAF